MNLFDQTTYRMVLAYPGTPIESNVILYSIDSYVVDLGESDLMIILETKVSASAIDTSAMPDIAILIGEKRNISSSIRWGSSSPADLQIFEIKEINIKDKRREAPFREYGEVNLPVGWTDTFHRTITITFGKYRSEEGFHIENLSSKIMEFRRELKLDELL